MNFPWHFQTNPSWRKPNLKLMLKYSPFLFAVFWFDPAWRQTCCSFVAMSNPSRPLLVTDPTPCESEWFNATATVGIFQWLLVKSHLLSPEKYPYDIPLYTTIGLLPDQHPIPILSPISVQDPQNGLVITFQLPDSSSYWDIRRERLGARAIHLLPKWDMISPPL